MASFINFLQVNQHIEKLTSYGGIAPLAQSKWYIGEPDQDPKTQPIDVYITDNDGNKQILAQPIETDAIGNFINKNDQSQTPIHPKIDQSVYSLLIEVSDINGQPVTYEWQSVTAEINDTDTYQRKDELIDISRVTPTSDIANNAPTAKSVIDADKNLQNQINENKLAVSGYKFSKSFVSYGQRQLINLSEVEGIIRVIGFASGGGGGGIQVEINTPEGQICQPSYGGQSGGVFDVYLNASVFTILTVETGVGGTGGQNIVGGDPNGKKGGDISIGTNIITYAKAFGGAGGIGALTNASTIENTTMLYAGGYWINTNVAYGTGRIGTYSTQGNIVRATPSSSSTKTSLCTKGMGGLSGISDFYQNPFQTGAGGDGSALYITDGAANGDAGSNGINGSLIIFSNQEIPDLA